MQFLALKTKIGPIMRGKSALDLFTNCTFRFLTVIPNFWTIGQPAKEKDPSKSFFAFLPASSPLL